MEYFILSMLIGFIALTANNRKKINQLEKEINHLKNKNYSKGS
jgi:hypothetical protein